MCAKSKRDFLWSLRVISFNFMTCFARKAFSAVNVIRENFYTICVISLWDIFCKKNEFPAVFSIHKPFECSFFSYAGCAVNAAKKRVNTNKLAFRDAFGS